MAVPDRRHADAGDEVDEAVAVEIFQHRALAAGEREPGQRRDRLDAGREQRPLALDHRARTRPGQRAVHSAKPHLLRNPRRTTRARQTSVAFEVTATSASIAITRWCRGRATPGSRKRATSGDRHTHAPM